MANKYIYPANGRVNTQIASVGDSKVNKEEMKEKVKLLSENLSLISYNKIRAELPILCMNSNCIARFAPHINVLIDIKPSAFLVLINKKEKIEPQNNVSCYYLTSSIKNDL